MSLEYWDFRRDIKNVLITPQIRSRFMQIKAGTTTGSHTHDLGHEIFMVMEGTIEFDVAGRKAILGPGQMCVALVDEPHTLRVIGDQDATIYLSVTPHVEPTHTFWAESGKRQPSRWGGASKRERETSGVPNPPIDDLIARHKNLSEALAIATSSATNASHRGLADLESSVARGDRAATLALLETLGGDLTRVYLALFALTEAWNDLAAIASEA